MALTKQGRNLMSWLRHWEISSRIADDGDEGALTDKAKKDEKRALALFRRQVKLRYTKRWRVPQGSGFK